MIVNLGIKGQDKTINSLTGVEKGLKGVGSVSLEAKAAIVGAMYALEQLFAKSTTAGTDLTNFNALLGEGTQTLQKYQYAARQVGISNDEVSGTFKSLQSTATKIRFGLGAPSMLGQVQQKVGLTTTEIDQMMKNPELLLQKLQEYAQKEKNIGIANETLRSFGLSDNVIAGLRRNAFTPAAFKGAPGYSDKEIKNLDKANIAWSNLNNKIQMAIGHFSASHGLDLVKDFSRLVDLTEHVINNIVKIADKIGVFKAIDISFSGLDEAIKQIGKLTDSLSILDSKSDSAKNLSKSFEDMAKGLSDALKYVKELAEYLKVFDVISYFIESATSAGNVKSSTKSTERQADEKSGQQRVQELYDSFKNESAKDILLGFIGAGSPSLKNAQNAAPNITNAPSSENSTQNVTVNQTLNFPTNAGNPKDHANAVNKAVKDAFRQLPSQVQGS